MGTNLEKIDPFDPKTGHVQVIIDTPKGRRNKYHYNESRGLFELKSVLPAGHIFPFDFGFIPGTRAEDGDPLDVLVLLEESADQGCLVRTRLIAVIEAEQTENGKTQRNDRLIGVAVSSHDYRSVHSLEQLSPNLADEIEHFFVSYNQLAGKLFRPIRRGGGDQALALLRQGMHAEVA